MRVHLPKSKREGVYIPGILHTAARQNFLLVNNLRSDGTGWRFTLSLNPEYRSYKGGRIVEHSPYTRLNHRLDRTVHAVCWHGHRDFFRTCYKINPDLVFVTGIARYNGSEDFEEKFPDTGYRNIGSQMQPCSYRDACYCGLDEDMVGEGKPHGSCIPQEL